MGGTLTLWNLVVFTTNGPTGRLFVTTKLLNDLTIKHRARPAI